MPEKPPEPAYEAVDRAWQRLQGAIEAHAAVAADSDAGWVRVGLAVVRRRAQALVRALDGLIEGDENG